MPALAHLPVHTPVRMLAGIAAVPGDMQTYKHEHNNIAERALHAWAVTVYQTPGREVGKLRHAEGLLFALQLVMSWQQVWPRRNHKTHSISTLCTCNMALSWVIAP